MKKNLLILLVLSIAFNGIAQSIFPTNGNNVGIGTTSPSTRLDFLSGPGQTENFMRFRVSDALADYLQISNITGEPNQFIPLIKGYHQTDNRFALALMGATSDAMDNGTNALINFNARRSNSVVQNRPLFVWTNYDQKLMTMAANGNLGIGTTSPNVPFHIKKNQSGWLQEIAGTASSSGDFVGLKILSGYAGEINKWIGIKAIAENQHSNLTGLSLLTGNSERLRISSAGNVGIGTSNPAVRLDLQSNAGQTETFMRFRVADALADYLQISNTTGEPNQFIPLIKGYHQTDNRIALALMGSTSDAMDTGTHALIDFNARRSNSRILNRTLFTWTNYDQKLMTMTADGNVGIGTTNPAGYKLAVNGNIHTKEVRVDLNGWPDFVFEKNYLLPSLKEVENYIEKNGHLENIPSATEVTENGVQLGEMNAKLLQKIEELTLYMIEQNKKTEELQKEVSLLKNKNVELEKRIK